jgi:hypothetical protein
MDPRLEQALKFANYRFTLQNQKENLKFRLLDSLNYSTNGGLFKVEPNLIMYVKLLIDLGDTAKVLIDNNSNPIKIDDLKDFFENILSLYNEVLNEYHIEYDKLKNKNINLSGFSDEKHFGYK